MLFGVDVVLFIGYGWTYGRFPLGQMANLKTVSTVPTVYSKGINIIFKADFCKYYGLCSKTALKIFCEGNHYVLRILLPLVPCFLIYEQDVMRAWQEAKRGAFQG